VRTAWLLARAGLVDESVHAPQGGRAPAGHAGLAVAARPAEARSAAVKRAPVEKPLEDEIVQLGDTETSIPADAAEMELFARTAQRSTEERDG
jgi:hypothetical protein